MDNRLREIPVLKAGRPFGQKGDTGGEGERRQRAGVEAHVSSKVEVRNRQIHGNFRRPRWGRALETEAKGNTKLLRKLLLRTLRHTHARNQTAE